MKPRLLNGPDDAVRLWWRLTAREETAGGRDPFLMKGNVLADECAACGHDRHHEVPVKRGRGWVDRCLRCGAVWPSGLEYVVRGTIRLTPRPHGIEHRLVDLGDLEVAIDQIPKRDARLYGLYLATDRSYEFLTLPANEIAEEMRWEWPPPAKELLEQWLAWPGGLTIGLVRGAVKRSRRVLRGALERRALIARQLPVLMRTGDRENLEALEPLPAEVVVPADPLRWDGLLHEFSVDALERLAIAPGALTRLSRGSSPSLGTIYREVPV